MRFWRPPDFAGLAPGEQLRPYSCLNASLPPVTFKGALLQLPRQVARVGARGEAQAQLQRTRSNYKSAGSCTNNIPELQLQCGEEDTMVDPNISTEKSGNQTDRVCW